MIGLLTHNARSRASRWIAAGALLVASLHASAATIVVGAKNFTEQYVLNEITAQYLRAKGYTVEARAGLGSTLMRSAQENGQLDVVWEYTGTAALVYDKITEKLDAKTLYERVRTLDAKRNLIWLDPSPLNDTYAIGLSQKFARETGIRTVSQLAAKLAAEPNTKHVFAMDAEFANRADGLKPFEAAYGMRFSRADTRQMDPGLVYTALHNSQVPIGLIYSTDGRVKGFNIVALEDDRHYFPYYNATPVVRKATLDQNPQLAKQLNALSAALNNDEILEMNKQVDIDNRPVRDVAADFLRTHKLP